MSGKELAKKLEREGRKLLHRLWASAWLPVIWIVGSECRLRPETARLAAWKT